MLHQPVPPAKRSFASSLRREMTEAEGRLWYERRDRRLDRIKFRRQVPVGRYIADFVCLEANACRLKVCSGFGTTTCIRTKPVRRDRWQPARRLGDRQDPPS
ncbi:DUF559 domain-containing protein [Mesorhizobium sp. YC-39]|uniref:DUF559 domain-containing protein n=1 Tax=Mesorhizobium sp. YC-2 TaxID=2986064 RepID=UPI002980ED9D|nr:DUF559 domain-containing protein [Mesorhizobium sp. YC-39]